MARSDRLMRILAVHVLRYGVVAIAALALASCGGGDGTTGPDEVPLPTIDAAGGVVRSADSKATLQIPPGALSQPTAITITPATPSAHPRLIPGSEYAFEPDGLQFGVPASLTIQLDSIPAVLADEAEYVWLHRREGDDLVAVDGEPTASGSLQVRGEITGFSNYGGAISQLAADLLLAAQRLDALLTDAIPENAIALMQTLAALFQQQADPAWQALAQPVLDGILVTVCNAHASAIANARDAPLDNWGVFTELLEPAYSWEGTARLYSDDGCPNSPLTLDQLQTLKIQQFIDFYVSRLDPGSFNQDFTRLTDEVQFVVELRGSVRLLGLEDADVRLQDEAQYPLMDELRRSTYSLCRSNGTHDYLGRLIALVPAANYSEDDVFNDLQYCATRLDWKVESENQVVSTNGTLGGGALPSTETVNGMSTGIAKGLIVLSGDIRAFKCPNGSFAQDELIVTLRGTEVHRRSATGGMFFPTPLELDAETILDAAGVDPSSTGNVPLVVSRVSQDLGCSFYAQSTTEIQLVTLNLEFPPPFGYVEDFEGDAGLEWSDQTVSNAPNGPRFLGPFLDSSVSLMLDDLPPHTQVTIEFDLYVIGSWNGYDPGNCFADACTDTFTFSAAGITLKETSFSNRQGVNQSYPGNLPSNSFPALTGASEYKTLGYYLDPFYEEDAVYRDMTFAINHSGSSIMFTWASDTSSGDEMMGIDNIRVSVQ